MGKGGVKNFEKKEKRKMRVLALKKEGYHSM
jgi:hypothetical protein